MKLSTQEEYGLRCLLQLARQGPGKTLTIPEISHEEGLSSHNVAKILRILRRGGLVTSERGQHGGYALACLPAELSVLQVMDVLGGRLYDPAFCAHYAGSRENCNRSFSTCSVRALWTRVQRAVDGVLRDITLQDLLHDGHYKFAASGGTGDELVQIAAHD